MRTANANEAFPAESTDLERIVGITCTFSVMSRCGMRRPISGLIKPGVPSVVHHRECPAPEAMLLRLGESVNSQSLQICRDSYYTVAKRTVMT
jgi:hypothetical protein